MQDKVYNEEEKDFHVAQGIWKNNNILFNMVKEDIDGLITNRLLAFLDGHPAIKALCTTDKTIIAPVDYKK